MTIQMSQKLAKSSTSLVPAYLDYGPRHDLDPKEVARIFSQAGLTSFGKWSFTEAYATSSLIRFARSEDVPPWVSANAMLDSSFSPVPPIAAEIRISLVCANVQTDSARFQLELSDVRSELARTWSDSVLERLTLRPSRLGRSVAIGFGFLIDTGDHLLRGSWLPEPSTPADSWRRVAIAERESACLISLLNAATGN